MSNPQLTEERLRTWILSQPDRERMCLALLALDRRYSDIRPRRPKGGPDGGRDIEAIRNGQQQVWGAVGFRNNANDSNEDKAWVREKFDDDLGKVVSANPRPHGFAFFTNVDLTPSEQRDLQMKGGTAGVGFVDLYYRERLRILLDSPKGLAYRFQYLNIPLSDAEQATFFTEFGQELQELLSGRFDRVDDRLARMVFFQECAKSLGHVSAVVTLDEVYTPSELHHFRYMIVVTKSNATPYPSLHIGGRDEYLDSPDDTDPTNKVFGEKSLVWSNPQIILQSVAPGGTLSQRELVSSFPFKSVAGVGPLKTLGDFDGSLMRVVVTKPLSEHILRIRLCVNGYVLFEADESVIRYGRCITGPTWRWPRPLSEAEARVPWVQVYLQTDRADLEQPEMRKQVYFWPIAFGANPPQRSEY